MGGSPQSLAEPRLPLGSAESRIAGLPFRLIEPKRGHRTGPESAVLGELLRGHHANAVLDLGAGSGVLGLLAAAVACGPCEVDLVERNPDFAAYAEANAARAAGEVRIHITDLREFDTTRTWPLVVANPPWFDPGAGRESSNALSHAATHALHGGYDVFLAAGERVLAPYGTLWIGTPADRVCDLLAAALCVGLSPATIALLHARHTGRPYRTWIALRRGPSALLRVDVGVATAR